MRNTPIQGGAAVVFKRALIDLDRAFRGTSVWLVMQVYDSVLIECERAEMEAVAERAAAVMRAALRSSYPALDPKVDVNCSRPGCWNKDGDAGSLDRFLATQQLDWLPDHDDRVTWREMGLAARDHGYALTPCAAGSVGGREGSGGRRVLAQQLDVPPGVERQTSRATHRH